MTAIQQHQLTSHHTIDEKKHHSGNSNEGEAVRGRPAMESSIGAEDSTWSEASGTVHISFQATMRLRAFQEQRDNLPEFGAGSHVKNGFAINQSNLQNRVDLDKSSPELNPNTVPASHPVTRATGNGEFSKRIESMLSEIQSNLITANEPGYQHLVNVLRNYGPVVDDEQQLDEIMRREQFFLTRRKPFMNNTEFQSFSQVLNQFANIASRQQISL
jgi:hypothetical protein